MQQIFSLLVALVLGFSAGPVLPASESYRGTAFYPFTLGDCTPARADSHGRGICDPVNLIFPERTWTEVLEEMKELDWTPLGLATNQWLQLGVQSVLFKQNTHLFFWQRDGSRYHIRLWQAGSTTFGAVHYEKAITTHVIDKDWEDAEAFVAEQLCPDKAVCRLTELLTHQQSIQGGNEYWRGWKNDARATVISFR
jgi:hypothetical protein